MTKTLFTFIVLAVAAGCGSPTNDTRSSGNQAAATPAPVTPAPVGTQNSVNSADQTERNIHGHAAPHGGTLVAFGEEFAHVEIVLDASTGQITAYVLDGEGEKSVQIAQENIVIEIEKPVEFSLTLVAVENALTGEKPGATSEFRGQSDRLKNLSTFDAHITAITVRGRQFKNVGFNFPKGNEDSH